MALDPPTDDVLKHMAKIHVPYELQRVVQFWVWGNDVALAPEPDASEEETMYRTGWVQAAILESALVHLRNVSDFLTKCRPTNKKFETDLVADHYFANGWRKRPDFIIGGGKKKHKDLLDEINWRVDHLTTQRYSIKDEGDFKWNEYVKKQFPVILPAFRLFLYDLMECEPERALWFDDSDALLTQVGL